MKLIYIGGGRHITGIPAQDLDDSEIARLSGDFYLGQQELVDQLLYSKLYKLEQTEAPKRTKASEKPPTNGQDDITE